MLKVRVASATVLAVLSVAPGPALGLDLESALGEVAAANPTLAARGAMVEAARRRVGPAGAWPSPMVELGAVNVPTNGRFDMDPMTMKMLGVSQRVPLFGRTGLGRRSARQAVTAEQAAAEMTGFEVLGAAWHSYADAYYAGELARHAAGHRAVMDRMVETARARYQSGRGRLEDVLRAEAERARVLSDLALFRAEERGARARLDALRATEPGQGGDSLAPPPVVAVPTESAAWLAAVSPSHPRLRELAAQAERYRLAAQASRRMIWPDLEVRGSYGRRETLERGVAQDDMFNAMVGLMLPVFAGQRELSEAAEMEAMARASDEERRAATLELQQEVAATHAQALAAQRSVRLLADTVVVTQRRALEASWSAYSAGQTDLWRVFEAAHALYGEEVALTRTQQQLAGAEARLVALTGRGDLVGLTLPEVRRTR